MSRILVIQPHKMLQHAFSVALFPEHQVQVMEMIPDSLAVKEFDAVVVDAGALRERNSLAASELRNVQGWKIPTVWIEQETDAQAPVREELVVVDRPTGKEALRKALAECLGAAEAALTTESAKGQLGSSPATDAKENVIELVEVVEESSALETSKEPHKKTK
jgi:hypothetical protein